MTDIDTPFYRFNPLSQSPATPPVEGFNGNTMGFMHINKTAGSAVTEWFKVNGYNLWTPPGIHGVIPDLDYRRRRFCFTIVRNPYDRTASHFFMWRDNNRYFRSDVTLDQYVSALHNRHRHPGRVEGPFRDPRKDASIISLLSDRSARNYMFLLEKHGHLFGSCADWMTTPTAQDNLAIFKFEELDKLENFFTKRLPFRVPLKDVRVEITETKRLSSYKHLYSKESIEFIQEIYADDFRNLRYDA